MCGVLTRIIGFGDIPIGINVDEAGIMQDAYCIANYGTDRFGNNNPVYMINYGGGQSALYTYLAAFLINIFGYSLTIIRIPALIFSIIYLIFAFLITKDLKNKKIAILVEFIAVIVPWHFMQSRWAFDCNLMSAMLLTSIYALIKAKRKLGYILAGILFGISFYTYALSYIVIPIILVSLVGYMLYINKIKILDVMCLFIPMLIIAIPLLLNIFVNMGLIQEIKLSWISILKLYVFRIDEVNLNQIGYNFIQMFKCMFGYDYNDFNAFPIFGTLYYISIPFAIIGFYDSIKSMIDSIKKKELGIDIIMLINFIAVFICGILVEPSVYRINAIFISLIYYIALGISFVSKDKKTVFYGLIVLYILYFTAFLIYYFGVYGKENRNRSFNYTTIEVTQYIESNEKFDGKIINIRTKAIQPYIYTLIANKTSPEEFAENRIMNVSIFAYYRYVFYNDAISENVVYVLEFDEKLKDDLIEKGFEVENYNEDICILYKD